MLSAKLKKWYVNGVEDWGGETSPEFKQFARDLKSDLKQQAVKVNMEIVKFSSNHYYCSGFLRNKEDGEFIYFSISDVRNWKNEWAEHCLYRTAEDENDYYGGFNNYCKWEELAYKAKHIHDKALSLLK